MAIFAHKTLWDRLSLQNYVKCKWQENGSSKKNILPEEGEMDIRQPRQQMSITYGSVLEDFIYVGFLYVDQFRDGLHLWSHSLLKSLNNVYHIFS